MDTIKEVTTYAYTIIEDLFDDDYRKLVAEIKADNEKMKQELHKINIACTKRNLNNFCDGLFDALMERYNNDTYKVLQIADVILDSDRGI